MPQQPTIIDQSETVTLLSVLPGEKLRIQHDMNTPVGTDQVRVSLKGITLGLGSSLFVHHNAEVILDSVLTVDLLGKLVIGGGGELFLNSAIGANILDKIRFRPSSEHAVLNINAANVQISGAVTGFGLHDTILIGNLGAASGMWHQTSATGGTLDLFTGTGEQVGAINLNGKYSPGDFSVREIANPRGTATTNISFVATDTQNSYGAGALAELRNTPGAAALHNNYQHAWSHAGQ
jgi:hypothetical protein